ncbi:MAG: hypothetical protein JAY75_16450 [Candidatus Thiodiazotropha taylori]|nr:hypothetical protein [Candidatus Thiodiazotropha taylori]MCW4309806.1 hypothetical protein [Candidatus Thiodiazotropha endolucinida]
MKCSVIVYNESKYEYIRSDRIWLLGNSQIEEEENYKHLGVFNNKYLKLEPNIKNATDKLKGTFFSLVKSGIFYQDSLHPITCKKIYNAVVLPKALYGCEHWNSLTPTEILTLERAHRFCIKQMQSLGIRTRTDVALGLLAFLPIEVEIELKKLILFGQLCRLNSNFWARTLFLNRLTTYKIAPAKQMGFIPDIDRLLRKYQLGHILEKYLQDGIFPSKYSWKRIIKVKVHQKATEAWHNRTLTPEFHRFRLVHSEFRTHWLWAFSLENRKFLKPCITMVQLISKLCIINATDVCNYCHRNYDNIVDHCIHDCLYILRQRHIFWQEILSLGLDVYRYLSMQSKIVLSNIFLGSECQELYQLLSEKSEQFMIICFRNLHHMWRMYCSY